MPVAFLSELRASDLAEPSAREDASEGLPSNGRGLPSLLADLKVTAPEKLDRLVASLRGIVPGVRGLRFEGVPISEEYEVHFDEHSAAYTKRARNRPGFQFRFEMANGGVVPAHSASEGTLLTLGLLALLASPKHPKLLLLDNIDAGLHPRAGGELIGQLRKIMSNEPDLQIVVTTHSPYVLDHFQPQEIRLMTSDDAGHAIIGSLTDHPQFERWKEEMLPGEFWSTVGEDWLKKREAQGA
jgi:predicted ATPase